MALNTNAIITVEQYQSYISDTESLSNAKRAHIEQQINMSSDWVEEYLGFTLFSGSLATEVFSGLGIIDKYDMHHDTYRPKKRPVIGSPVLYTWSNEDWEAVTVDYGYDSESEVVYLKDNGNYFENGRHNYKLVYEHGYTSESAIPHDLKWACAIITKHNELLSQHQGKATETVGNQTFSYSWKIPKLATDILDRYK